MIHMSVSMIVVVLLALLTITFFWVGLRSRRKQAESRPLDLSAFRTLGDRDDETFFRDRLSRKEFFRWKRLRIRVTWKYVRRIADNSAVVMQSVAVQRRDQEATEVADQASHIRVLCLVAFAKLTVEYMFPVMQLSPAVLAPKYESLRQNLSRLGKDLAPLASAI